jgi:predicted MPP superfamily phosphohydrolase
LRSISRTLPGAAAALAAWSLWEAQWVELSEREVPLARLRELDGFTILHLSDFHLGTLSLNGRALRQALAWAERDAGDLVVLTGDLLSRQRGEADLRAALARLHPPTDLRALAEHGAVLLEDEAVVLDVGGRRVQVVGCDPRDWKLRSPERLADPGADLRILLSHFPDVVEHVRPGSFDLVLAGHLHGGQICLPTPRGKLRLEHLRARHWEGLHRTPAGWLHVSRGLGTSFVPFRLLARPEATRLVLRSA